MIILSSGPLPPPTPVTLQTAPPPLVLIVEQETVVYGPNGQRVTIQAASEIDVCASNGKLLVYEVGAMVVRMPRSCTERPLFADGFEGAP